MFAEKGVDEMTGKKIRRDRRPPIIMCALICAVFLLAAAALPWEMPFYSYNYVPAVVEQGDTLWSLTAKYNQDRDFGSLIPLTVSYNRLNNTNIQAGQIIYIPVRVRP
jgi:hypothetical protein